MLQDNWPVILIAAIVLAIVAYLLLKPRQSVRLSEESAPIRPHMQAPKAEAEGRGLAGEHAAATSDVAGEIIRAPVHRALAGGDMADDFTRLKGVGPKLAEALHAQGFNRYEQLASLSENELSRLDEQLGAFRGRLQRDRVTEQADYLARGDNDGFETKFGKL
jgi:predicted flap endonuclease-1-like 5' DNA nuclease